MDNKTLSKINDLIEKSFSYWYDLRSKYGFEKISIPVTFYPFTHLVEIDWSTVINLYKGNSRCRTIITSHFDDNNNIESLSYHVYWSYEDLYRLLIECDLDYDKTFESIKFTLRHEMGHIIDYNSRFIGKNINDWNKYVSDCEEIEQVIPKLRKNASYEKRMQWYLIYNSLPCEKQANEAVGITQQDIIDDYKRTHRK